MQCDDLIDRHYRLIRRKGHHWLAQDERTHLRCLIIPLDDFTDIRVVCWLEQVWHPGLPRVIERISDADRHPLAVLDYLPGKPLSDHLSSRRFCRPDRLLAIIRQAAHLMSFLHEASEPPLMHLDLKPEHWIMLPSGDLGLIDFQTARFYDSACQAAEHDPAAQKKMTLAYAAPECLSGQSCPASDLYALALMFMQYLTRRPPEYCRNHEPCGLLPKRLGDLAELLSCCLADNPSQRPPSMTVFLAELDRITPSLNLAGVWRKRCTASLNTIRGLGQTVIGRCSGRFKRGDRIEPRPPSSVMRVCIWQEAELACELAMVWSQHADVILLDLDLDDPRCAAYLQPHKGTASVSSVPVQTDDISESEMDRTDTNNMLDWTKTKTIANRRSLRLIDAGQTMRRRESENTAALLQLIRETEQHCEICLSVTSGLAHDAAACIGLMTADLIVMPLRADPVHWQSCQRQTRFLESKGALATGRIHYVLFPYQNQRDLSIASADQLIGAQLAGVISDCPERDRYRGSHRPYWTCMTRKNRQEYDRLIDHLQSLATQERRPSYAAG